MRESLSEDNKTDTVDLRFISASFRRQSYSSAKHMVYKQGSLSSEWIHKQPEHTNPNEIMDTTSLLRIYDVVCCFGLYCW
jgi:hypothetical protein